jgi:gas vesicle protein
MTENATRSGYGGMGVALAFLSGALAGAGLAFLLAPRSGPENRKRIAEAVHDSTDQVKRARMAATAAASAAREAFSAAMQEKH